MTIAPAPRSKLRRALFMALAEVQAETGRRHWHVAAEAGVHPATFSLILGGSRDPSQEQAAAIAAVLGKPVAEVFPEEGL